MRNDRIGVFLQHDRNYIEPARRLLHASLPEPGLRRLRNTTLLRLRYGFLRASEPETGTGFYFGEHDLALPGNSVGIITGWFAAYQIDLQAAEPVIAMENAVPDGFQIRGGNIFSPLPYVFSSFGHSSSDP